MKVDQVIEQAVQAGWSDDSRWTPRFITASLSREHQGMLAAVTVYTDGKVTWSSIPNQGRTGRRSGTARSLASGLRAALAHADAATATLF